MRPRPKALQACYPLLIRVLAWLMSAIAGLAQPGEPDEKPVPASNVHVLTHVAEIRQLSAEDADRRNPVHLRGVVLDFYETDPGSRDYALFLNDGTASIYIQGANGGACRPGQILEIDGVSAAGEFAPMVILSTLRVVGQGEAPAPRDLAYERLATGAEDGQWVRVRGVVRSATVSKNQQHPRAFIQLSTGNGRLTARVEDYQGGGADLLPDAEVSVTGVCIPLFNRKRQLFGLRLSLPSIDCLHVEHPAPAEPFSVPIRTINSLGRFAPNEPFGHRVKVRGTVTYQEFGTSLFIQDETQGVWVKTHQGTRVVPGDRLEVLGFPVIGEYTPVLEDAVFRLVDTGPPVTPLVLTAAQVREGDCDGGLVQVDAQVLERQQTPREIVLVLQEKDIMFRAHLERTAATLNAFAFAPGSRVRLNGVCLVQLENQRWPQSFRLLLRSSADVVLLRHPPWWSLSRLLWALGAMTLVVVGATLWIATLRRRVNAQTKIIKSDIQRATVLEERTRLAREFHDTLEQQLAGIRIQLDTIAEDLSELPEPVKRNFNVTRQMVRHSESEARRSVWDLRAPALEGSDLPAALSAIPVQAKEEHPVHIETSVLGERYALPGWMENHLLRIAQEGTANALKHAAASKIRIELYYETKTVRLSVRDDGHGFAADNATSSEAGHFGLLGMRERVDKLGGTLTIFSAPEHGTIIEVVVPLGSNALAGNS